MRCLNTIAILLFSSLLASAAASTTNTQLCRQYPNVFSGKAESRGDVEDLISILKTDPSSDFLYLTFLGAVCGWYLPKLETDNTVSKGSIPVLQTIANQSDDPSTQFLSQVLLWNCYIELSYYESVYGIEPVIDVNEGRKNVQDRIERMRMAEYDPIFDYLKIRDKGADFLRVDRNRGLGQKFHSKDAEQREILKYDKYLNEIRNKEIEYKGKKEEAWFTFALFRALLTAPQYYKLGVAPGDEVNYPPSFTRNMLVKVREIRSSEDPMCCDHLVSLRYFAWESAIGRFAWVEQDEAVKLLQQLIQEYPQMNSKRKCELLLHLGSFEVHRNKIDSAKTLFRQAKESDPLNKDADLKLNWAEKIKKGPTISKSDERSSVVLQRLSTFPLF